MALQIDLSETERSLLMKGILQWGGPACVTDELAVAMGFIGSDDLNVEHVRLYESLKSQSPLEAVDWARVLVMTEFVFASNVLGAGLDWETVTGLADTETIQILRLLQRKFGQAGVGRRQFGPTIHQEGQWHSTAAVAMRRYKHGQIDLPSLVSSLTETASSFSGDLAALETTRTELESLLDLPEAAQRTAVLDEFTRLEDIFSGRVAEGSYRRMFWI